MSVHVWSYSDAVLATSIRVAVRHDVELGIWEAWCPALDIFSQGDTEAEALAGIYSAAGLYVKLCSRRRVGVPDGVRKALSEACTVTDGVDALRAGRGER